MAVHATRGAADGAGAVYDPRHVFSNLLILLGIVLVVGLLLVVGLVLAMAHGLLRPGRMTDGKAVYILKRLSPGDLDMAFEDQSFIVRDEVDGRSLRIAGWWMPHPRGSTRTCVIAHGYGDAKVGGIAWAPSFRDLGFNVLAIDLRAHGESDGAFTTAGYRERHDLSQVVDQLRAARPAATGQLVLFGVSLGAAVVAGCAALRDDVDAVLLESPYDHFVHAAATHGRRMGMPLVSMQRVVVGLSGWMSGADYDAVAPATLIPRLKCPVMLIHSAEDTFVDPADAQTLREAMAARTADQGPTVFWEVPGAFHVEGLLVDPVLYEWKLREFLDAALGRPADREPPRLTATAPQLGEGVGDAPVTSPPRL